MAREDRPRRPSTNGNANFPTPLPKRVKIDVEALPDSHVPLTTPSQTNITRAESGVGNGIPDFGDEESADDAHLEASHCGPPGTQLEIACRPLKTDQDAINNYEAYKAARSLESDTAEEGLEDRSWSRSRSSIYVDAFNLALDTVLSEEQHLFSEAELKLFEDWKTLDYEGQYLYVRLFLRKTSKWFRIKDLHYYRDIANIDRSVQALQQQHPLPPIHEPPSLYPGELKPAEGAILAHTFCFAECSSQHINTLDEASSLLLLDELKVLAKDAKVRGKNKKELLHNLRQTSGQQTALAFPTRSCSETEPSDHTAAVSVANRDCHYTAKILDHTGRCIRLSLPPLRLFERVHLVFYRDTEWTEKSLTTLILAKISRRNFPQYLIHRSSAIFQSRDILLEFEASLRTQFRVDNLLEFNGTPGKQQYQQLLDIVDHIYPRWNALLAEEQRKEERLYDSGEGAYLRLFNPAWVYTRIMHKGLNAFARFKHYKREHQLLTELLDQRLFHAARRGGWYQRKALLEEHYMHALMPDQGRSEQDNKKHWKRVALRTCEQGLEDPECHIIYHYDLQKRICKLERQLRIPLRKKHDFGHVRLANPVERNVFGTKIERQHSPVRRLSKDVAASRGAKTVWLDELDTLEHVSVESMCLSHYRKVLGWKGYHSEGSILRMLFGLLFCDLLFAYVPNVFQTAYQTCPLDLHTDAFYPARISEINALVNQISNGQAETIISQVWQQHYDQKTSIVGVRWDDYDLADILEVARCFPADALGTVMRVLAQEYAARGGGVPDLFLWKPNPDGIAGQVMFVEVKSLNDRLSDTQRLWISVLLGAGIPVELCHAFARGTVYCVTPIEDEDYYGPYVKMSKEERRWGNAQCVMPKKVNRREPKRSAPYNLRVPSTSTEVRMATAIASPVGLPQWRSPHLHNQHNIWTADPTASNMDFSLPMMSTNFNMTTMGTATHQTLAPSLAPHHTQSTHHRSQSHPHIHLPTMHPQQSAPWTNGEDMMLLDAKSKGLGWNDIHEKYFPSKSGNACRKRHERLMVKLRTTDWDEARVRRVWDEYVREGVRREFWEAIAQRCGERWEDVERVCFQQGLKGLRTTAPSGGHSRARSSTSSRFGGGASASDVGDLGDRASRRISGGRVFEQVAEHDNHNGSTNASGMDGYSDTGPGKFGGETEDSGIDIRSLGPSRRSSNVGASLTTQGLEVLRQGHGHGHGSGTGYEYQ
ncbi:hypothetical protein DV736_g2833, partial [Chaetothyriales sp. CBS 134916]